MEMLSRLLIIALFSQRAILSELADEIAECHCNILLLSYMHIRESCDTRGRLVCVSAYMARGDSLFACWQSWSHISG